MAKISADDIKHFKKTAKGKIDTLTDDKVGEAFRKFLDRERPSPNIPHEQLDQKRIKTQKVDKKGVCNVTDDLLTNPNADNLPQEDLHEKLDELVDDWLGKL